MSKKSNVLPLTTEVHVLMADSRPVGVFFDYYTAVLERLRLSKAESERVNDKRQRLKFTLTKRVSLFTQSMPKPDGWDESFDRIA